MLTYYYKSLSSDADLVVRLLGNAPMYLCFTSQSELQRRLDQLKSSLLSCIFCFANIYLSKSSNANVAKSFMDTLADHQSDSSIPSAHLLFTYQLDTDEYSPSVKVDPLSSHVYRLKLNIDFLCQLSRNLPLKEVHTALCDGLEEFLCRYYDAVSNIWSSVSTPQSLHSHHYRIGQKLVTIFYPRLFSEEKELSLRSTIHQALELPLDVPLFRRGQALHPVPYLCTWLGPKESLLVCPHEELKLPGNNKGRIHLVRGRYTYKHYMQDNVDDRGWGCAYRSLQTLISWLMWQGEVTPSRLPSLNDIQSSLVRVGDKPKSFIGSRQWIGSLEVSFCLQELFDVQCRILPVSRGSDMCKTAASQLAQHFASGGGPVMVGGGQLAHTIIGVQLHEQPDLTDSRTVARYLILDPHYTGPAGNLRVVLDKGFCGWKEANFWKPDVFYNLCFLPAVRAGRV